MYIDRLPDTVRISVGSAIEIVLLKGRLDASLNNCLSNDLQGVIETNDQASQRKLITVSPKILPQPSNSRQHLEAQTPTAHHPINQF